MFVDASREDPATAKPAANIKHTMHGVSHVRPDEEDLYQTPPPVHYGVEEAIKARRGGGGEAAGGGSQMGGHRSGGGGGLSPFSASDSDRSRVAENFNSRSTIAERSLDRRDKFMSLDSLASATTSSASTFVDLGNIDLKGRDRRKSVDEESLAAQVRRRERSREAEENVRRISVHQDSFDNSGSATDGGSGGGGMSSSVASPKGTLETRVSVPSRYTSSVSIQKSKPVKYKIEYLGAVPLRTKATNLDSLQVPLKELYFKHKALQSLGHSNLPGTLEISDTGLKVQYIRELHKGVQELFNSFPTIAVWAAVKFNHKTVILPTGGGERRHRFAFTPLISDPANEERRRVFYDLDKEEISLATRGPHPPVFACVMRRSGQPKQLECHGFICASSEDAIIIAASLYQALVDTMKKHKAAGHSRADASSAQMSRADFNRRSSRRSSKRGEPPVRPPRKKRNRGEEQPPRVVTGLVRKRSIRSSTRSVRSNRSNRSNRSARRRGQRTVQIQREEFGRRSSRRAKNVGGGDKLGAGKPSGDLLTKVSIGRTKSFVKTGNQYNLQDLFRELKEKEGVESIDDVLKRVISPNGMSFNDIKPVYRELLLKLAMTMSQDEIFERSKSIMASNKKVKKKSRETENSGSLGSFFKSFSRPGSKSNSLVVASKKAGATSPATAAASLDIDKKLIGETMKGGGGGRGSKPAKSSRAKPLTKADISGPLPVLGDPPTRLNKDPPTRLNKDHPPPPPAGDGGEQTDDAYVSCSECAYESVCIYDTCPSCRMKMSPAAPARPSAADMKSLLGAAKDLPKECDADSCISSEKCYCSLRGDPRTMAAGVRSPHSHNKSAISSSVYSEATAADSGTATDCYSGTCYSGSVRSRGMNSSVSSPLSTWKRNKNTGSGHCCSCSEYSDNGGGSLAASSGKFNNRTLPPLPTEANVIIMNSPGSYDPSYAAQGPPGGGHWQDSARRRNMTDGRGSEGGSSSSSSSSHRSSASPTNSSFHHSASPTNSSFSHSASPSSSHSQPKVLVVSAVDPRGNVVYRGSSSSPAAANNHHAAKHGHSGGKQLHNHHPTGSGGGGQSEQNILSLKKSAEIAAMFSGARISTTTDLVHQESTTSSCSCSSSSQHSLRSHQANIGAHMGYFP